MAKANIFKAGSKTYYYSSLFFPPQLRANVSTLYEFVRTVDDLVDQIPQKATEFYLFKQMTLHHYQQKTIAQNSIIANFIQLANDYTFDPAWTEAFFNSMEADLSIKKYQSYADLQKYIHGSAEVIGLMMSKLMDLPKESYPFAQKLGEGMQFINFVRDIQEDLDLGRQYMPQNDLNKFSISHLPPQKHEIERFKQFIRLEIDRFMIIIQQGKKGFRYIPRTYRIPIQTATQMYEWTAQEILKDPMIVFKKKVKPSIIRIVVQLMINSIS